MSHLSPKDDEKLVEFLKEYRPLPPPPKSSLEDELIELIESEPVISGYSAHWRWLLPSTLAASLVLFLGMYRVLSPTPQMAQVSPEELEGFLVESWTGIVGEPLTPMTAHTAPESTWLSLADANLTNSYP